MTEQQPYDAVRSCDGFELRRYRAHLLAEVTVAASFTDAGNKAFRYLFGYISGDNRSNTKVAMTAPVVQSSSGSQIAMTAPVVQQAQNSSGYQVAFVLPASLTLETAPQPTNPLVRLRTVPESLTAVVRFRGHWSEANYRTHLAALTSALADAALNPTGPPRFARFDPPFKPWFLRHNEVMLDVEAIGGSTDSSEPQGLD